MRAYWLISFGCLAVGFALMAFGLGASGAPAEPGTEALNDAARDGTAWYLIGGGLALTVGLVLAFADRRA